MFTHASRDLQTWTRQNVDGTFLRLIDSVAALDLIAELEFTILYISSTGEALRALRLDGHVTNGTQVCWFD